jgi:hypothetical protein
MKIELTLSQAEVNEALTAFANDIIPGARREILSARWRITDEEEFVVLELVERTSSAQPTEVRTGGTDFTLNLPGTIDNPWKPSDWKPSSDCVRLAGEAESPQPGATPEPKPYDADTDFPI